jgi:diamine N-acetyltransferase
MFKDITSKPEPFFNILPNDWQESIVPFWDLYKDIAKVYVIEIQQKIYVGGIVFFEIPPDMENFKDEAIYWSNKEYYYIGYVWTAEDVRGQNYGSKWLAHLIENDPNQHFWLTTENTELRYFYEKNGFTFIKKLVNESIELFTL